MAESVLFVYATQDSAVLLNCPEKLKLYEKVLVVQLLQHQSHSFYYSQIEQYNFITVCGMNERADA